MCSAPDGPHLPPRPKTGIGGQTKPDRWHVCSSACTQEGTPLPSNVSCSARAFAGSQPLHQATIATAATMPRPSQRRPQQQQQPQQQHQRNFSRPRAAAQRPPIGAPTRHPDPLGIPAHQHAAQQPPRHYRPIKALHRPTHPPTQSLRESGDAFTHNHVALGCGLGFPQLFQNGVEHETVQTMVGFGPKLAYADQTTRNCALTHARTCTI